MQLSKTATNLDEIIIAEDVTYETFDTYAQKFLETTKMKVVKKLNCASEKIWELEYQQKILLLCYDEWFYEMSLFCKDDENIIKEIYEKFKDLVIFH